MIRRPPRSTHCISSAASDVYKRQGINAEYMGAFVLVDEPELSLHPRWQMKILSFLKSLFTNEEGIQTSQIIITTHSPFIIHNCDRSNDKVIILEKSEEGVISVSDTPSYYSWTNEELVKEAFNISYELPEDKITVFVEGETDEKYYKRALEVYGLNGSILNFKWIGNYNEQGNVENTGDTGLNHAFNFYKANPRMINNKVVLLYDSDTKKQESQLDNNLFIKMMAVNNGNGLYKIGIENLLMLHNGFDKDRYYKTEVKPNKYGGETITRNLDKTKLCNEICQLDNETLKEVFTNIKLEIDKLLVLQVIHSINVADRQQKWMSFITFNSGQIGGRNIKPKSASKIVEQNISDRFPDVRKMISIGSGFQLSKINDSTLKTVTDKTRRKNN
eukprot:TRINITY_DN9906_c0_g1_i1.p1 TRINITY_DN9906_c0_g1~~TRINITY_DN9906_c0_g1_i1.p1  ORF type:complete len:389 (-),score=75.21 TRINITY_DN9906_c0_g1_i1:264-1430(-)